MGWLEVGMRVRWRAAVGLVATVVMVGTGTVASPAHATDTIPATGTFSFTTANGILPTWTAENLVIVGVSPGSAVTSAANTYARVSVPIVAKTGTANAAAGGFRIINITSGANVRCSVPTIDTRARLVDCVLADGSQRTLFKIVSIGSRTSIAGTSTFTTIFRRMQLQIADDETADLLNRSLATTAFSPYVTVGTGDLVVSRTR